MAVEEIFCCLTADNVIGHLTHALFWFLNFHKQFHGIMVSQLDATPVHVSPNTLRKHAFSNIMKILPPKNEKLQKKILIFFIILLKT